MIKLIPLMAPSSSMTRIEMNDKNALADLYATLAMTIPYLRHTADGNSLGVASVRINDAFNLMATYHLLDVCKSVSFNASEANIASRRMEYFIMHHHSLKRADLATGDAYVLMPRKLIKNLDEPDSELVNSASCHFVGAQMQYVVLLGVSDIDITKYELSKSSNTSITKLSDPGHITMDQIPFIAEKLKPRFEVVQWP